MASITAASALALGWVSGCSVLYDLETKQCSVDADCAALGGVFEGLACIENLCQEPPITGCQSNAQCIDEQGNNFEPWICVDQEAAEGSVRRSRECVKLTTTECPTMLPLGEGELYLQILRSENPLILAGSGLIGGTTVLDARMRNYDLALKELDSTNQGLPSGRRVAMIGCTSSFEDEGALEREMDHLINKVKVPGIVSSYIAEDLQRAFNDYGKVAQTFFMSARESDATLGAIPDDGLIWHIGPGTDVLARAYAPLFTRTLAHLGIAEQTGVKVASVVTTTERFLSNMAPAIERPPEEYGLSFNAKSVSANLDAGDYLSVGISSDADSDISTQLDAILALQPHVIISLADQQFTLRIMTAVESEWPAGGQPKPFYLLSPYNFGDPALLNLLQTNSSLQARIAGVNGAAGTDRAVYNEYTSAFRRAFPESDPGDVNYENFYDAAYYLLYAAAAAGQTIDNGQSLRVGFNRLLSGPSFDVGTSDMPVAMSTLLNASATIQLNGTLGPPDWNTINGTRKSYGSIWCVDATRTFRSDVLRYVPNDANPTQAGLTGDFPSACIPDF
jgi:hypothetical protein